MMRKRLRDDDCGGKKVVEFLQKVVVESFNVASDFRELGGGEKSSFCLERPGWHRLSKGILCSLSLTVFPFSL